MYLRVVYSDQVHFYFPAGTSSFARPDPWWESPPLL